MGLIQSLKKQQISFIVYPEEIEDIALIQDFKRLEFKTISVIDTRSVLYIATGIAAQNQELVVCIVNSSNASRSVFSGMTEAFYRKLPIILITIGTDLDYSIELGDVVQNHFVVSDTDDISALLNKGYPLHLELQTNCVELWKTECNELQRILNQYLDKDKYLLIGVGIEVLQNNDYKCKTVVNRMPNCYEGALAYVLGASLAKNRSRYIALVSEMEFLHDINTLGNIHMNERILFIVVTGKVNETIEEYSRALGFETLFFEQGNNNIQDLFNAVSNNKKTVVQYIKEI